MLIFWIACLFCFASTYGKLPAYIKRCSKTSGTSECIRANIEAARPYFGEGIPDLYLPPLNPWKLPSIRTQTPFFRFDVYNVSIWGLEKSVIEELEFKLDEGIFDLKLKVPVLSGEASYDIEGNLFLFDLKSKGYAAGNITNLDASIKIRGTKRVVKGETYMLFKKIGYTMVIEDAYVYLDKVFPNNQFLSEAFGRAMNTRAVEFIYLITPTLDSIVTTPILNALNGIFSNNTLNELFID